MAAPFGIPPELLEHLAKCREEYDRALERLNAFNRPAENVSSATWLPNSTAGPSRVQPEFHVISSDEDDSNEEDSDEKDKDERDSDEGDEIQNPRQPTQQHQAGPSRIPLSLCKHITMSREEDNSTPATCQSPHRPSPAERIISEVRAPSVVTAIDAAPDTSDSPARAGPSKKRPRRQTLDNEDVTETFAEAPKDVMTYTCNCRDRCSTRRCTCRKWGGRCKEGCQCRSGKAVEKSLGPECHNPFEDVTRKFFGENHPNVRASDCFVSFVEKRLKKGQHCDPSKMAKTLLNADDGIVWDSETNDMAPNLSEWRARLADFPSGSVERQEHMQLLFRGALGEGDVCGEDGIGLYKWNFCENQWYDESGPFTHCPTCGECIAYREQWHCGACRKCRYNRHSPCEKCGGISSSLKEHREARKKQLVEEKRRKEKERQDRDMSMEEREQLRRNWERQVSEERARRERRR